jgi:hypothetical protein
LLPGVPTSVLSTIVLTAEPPANTLTLAVPDSVVCEATPPDDTISWACAAPELAPPLR